MDSLCPGGFAVPCNLGVMDSTGATAFFETGATSYTRWDADSVADGFLVLANFSRSGDSTGQSSYSRYLHANQLVARAAREHYLSVEYLIGQLSPDLGGVGFNPYPLPYEGSVGAMPIGLLPTRTTINRSRTRAAILMVGRRAGEPVALSQMWAVLGEPIAGIAVPLWVGAGAVPEEARDLPRAALCDAAQQARQDIYSESQYPDAVNSYRLAEMDRELEPFRTGNYEAAERLLARWSASPPTPQDLLVFEEQACRRAMAGYAGIGRADPESKLPASSTGNLEVDSDPWRGSVEISFDGDAENRRLTVYNRAGQVMEQFNLAAPVYQQPGRHSVRWSPTGLAAGLYFATLEVAARRATARFAYLR